VIAEKYWTKKKILPPTECPIFSTQNLWKSSPGHRLTTPSGCTHSRGMVCVADPWQTGWQHGADQMLAAFCRKWKHRTRSKYNSWWPVPCELWVLSWFPKTIRWNVKDW